MRLTLLGTGCPSVDHKRFGPANLINPLFSRTTLPEAISPRGGAIALLLSL